MNSVAECNSICVHIKKKKKKKEVPYQSQKWQFYKNIRVF